MGHDSGWVAEIRFSLVGSAGARCAEKKFGRPIGYLRFRDRAVGIKTGPSSLPYRL